MNNKQHISIDPLPPYKTYGRYVCDWRCSEAYLFNNVKDAKAFAKKWNRDCNIGWLPPVYVSSTGRNRKATASEAKGFISRSVTIYDHR